LPNSVRAPTRNSQGVVAEALFDPTLAANGCERGVEKVVSAMSSGRRKTLPEGRVHTTAPPPVNSFSTMRLMKRPVLR
jgi:hypothetical protein